MNTIKKIYRLVKAPVLAIALCVLIGRMSAQDFHLSQYDLFPLYYNPAQTGMYGGEKMDYRFFGNYRSQWQKLQGKPYSAFGVGFDMPVNRYGVGILVMDHIAGWITLPGHPILQLLKFCFRELTELQARAAETIFFPQVFS